METRRSRNRRLAAARKAVAAARPAGRTDMDDVEIIWEQIMAAGKDTHLESLLDLLRLTNAVEALNRQSHY